MKCSPSICAGTPLFRWRVGMHMAMAMAFEHAMAIFCEPEATGWRNRNASYANAKSLITADLHSMHMHHTTGTTAAICNYYGFSLSRHSNGGGTRQ